MAHTPEHAHNGAGHEKREVDVRIIIETLIGLTVSVVAACVIVWIVFFVFKTKNPDRLSAEAGLTQVPPAPRLQVHPSEELTALRSSEEQILNSYRWVDPKTGIVHIPIQKAMDEVVSKLPGRPQKEGGASATTH
jgi:hypothetical protein